MASAVQPLIIGLISDIGGPASSGTTFYYNVGSTGDGFKPTNSFAPGPLAVSQLVQSWMPSDVMAIGDLAYNVGASTLQDISLGQYYNNFMYPYPSPNYLAGAYKEIAGTAVQEGRLAWPYNIYNYPFGFPNPVTGESGGSPDQKNHFWGALGNHDYGLEVGYAQVGVTPYNQRGNSTTGPNGQAQPVGPSSTPSVQSAIDYFLPFLQNPALLGADQARLNVGAVDPTGNRGAYYSISLGGTVDQPLIDFFILDTARLNINSGFENYNPSGTRVLVGDQYENKVKKNKSNSLKYNPVDPNSSAYAGTTTDPSNGFDQFIWLRDALVNSKAKWQIIAGHHPAYTSGRWDDTQPDDHMSIPYLQNFLNALPKGLMDIFYNGHDHYYERVLESLEGGIGLGIPFITNGNSGRNLEQKIQVPYGTSVYEPQDYEGSNPKKEGEPKLPNPNNGAMGYLLQSGPLAVGSSGLAGGGEKEQRETYKNGLYGYGMGAVRLEADDDYLLTRYQEADLVDPAIANHLPGGIAPQAGFAETTAQDWIPDPMGLFNGKSDLAQFKLNITNGVVTSINKLNAGRGYMSSKGGNHTVKGFNIYGNNNDPLKPWLGTAKVDLVFASGVLEDVILTDGGSGYELAVQAAADNNSATSTDELPEDRSIVVAIDYNINEIQYLVRDTSLYNDWYLQANTGIAAQALSLGDFGGLQLDIKPRSQKAQDLLSTLPITTGYSGVGAQRAYTAPQRGRVNVSDVNGTLVAGGEPTALQDGVTSLAFKTRPAPGPVTVAFDGDPLSSYLVNFRASSSSLNLSYGNWSSGVSSTSSQTITFAQDVFLSLTRTDSLNGSISLGLRRDADPTPAILISNAQAASASALTTNSVFVPTGEESWLATEHQSLGSSTASLSRLAAGTWTPVARDASGQDLAVKSITISGNAIAVEFAGGIQALYNSSGTGAASGLPGSGSVVLTVQRLGSQSNGLAFYKADPVTGAVTLNGQSFLPADPGYLQAALASAQQDQLIFGPERLPGYGEQKLMTGLPLDPTNNYGLLLLRNGNSGDLVSSYSAANPGGAVSMISYVAPGRGIVYGIEDQHLPIADRDYNDFIVTIAAPTFTLV